MKTKQLFKVIDTMVDNILTDVHTEDGKQKCKENFKIWLNLSWTGGLFGIEDLATLRQYGLDKIDYIYEKFCI